jgi:ketose-bisphosphate aldolase
MTLVNMKQMLYEARRGKYAVAAFDISNYEMMKAAMESAQELNSPIILSFLKMDLDGLGIDYLSSMAKTAGLLSKVPVCIHLDHSVEFELIKQAIDRGFTSVMFDGSSLSFEENARITRQVCDYAHKYSVTVEAELGHVTDALSGNSESGGPVAKEEDPKKFFTEVNEVKDFIARTDVDALAVAIGTAHGVYTKKPELDFKLLSEINNVSKVPLVLHGGSGTPDNDIKMTIELGMCKINIYSEILNAFFSSLRDTLNNTQNMSSWPSVIFKKPVEAMKDIISKKIILCGSQNKA